MGLVKEAAILNLKVSLRGTKRPALENGGIAFSMSLPDAWISDGL